MSMEKLLREIAAIPGVTGSCVFDRHRGPLCRDLDSPLTAEMFRDVGMHLVRLVQMGGMCGLSVRSSHFRFDRYTVVGIPLDNGAILMTICETQANCSLIATTAGMLVADMCDSLAGRGGETGPEPESDAAPTSGQESETDAAGTDLEMEGYLRDIEQALAGAIGPVAEVVMQDFLEKWRANGPVIPARLSELAAMLAEEIGDEELASEFRSRIQDII